MAYGLGHENAQIIEYFMQAHPNYNIIKMVAFMWGRTPPELSLAFLIVTHKAFFSATNQSLKLEKNSPIMLVEWIVKFPESFFFFFYGDVWQYWFDYLLVAIS